MNENVTSDSCFLETKFHGRLISDKGAFLAGAAFPSWPCFDHWEDETPFDSSGLGQSNTSHSQSPGQLLTAVVEQLSVCCRFITTTTLRDYIRHKFKYLHQTGFSGPRFGSDLIHSCRAELTTRSKYPTLSISICSTRSLCAAVLRITMFRCKQPTCVKSPIYCPQIVVFKLHENNN